MAPAPLTQMSNPQSGVAICAPTAATPAAKKAATSAALSSPTAPTFFDRLPAKAYSQRAVRIGSALAYGFASLLIISANKAVLTTFRFPSAKFLGLSQFAFTLLTFTLLSAKWPAALCASLRGSTSAAPAAAASARTSPTAPTSPTALAAAAAAAPRVVIRPASWDLLRRVAPLSFLFITNVVTGLMGTSAVNLAMFGALRRFSIMMTLVLEFLVLGTRPSNTTTWSVVVMIAGALVAASNDLAFDAFGYTVVFANNLCTAGQGVCVKRILSGKFRLSKFELLYYQALVATPVLALSIAARNGEFQRVLDFEGTAVRGGARCAGGAVRGWGDGVLCGAGRAHFSH